MEQTIKNAKEAFNVIKDSLMALDHEECRVAFLGVRNKLIGTMVVGIGNIDSCVIDKRRIVKECLLKNAIGVILYHNHPKSGDARPSKADIAKTEELRNACDLFDILLIDHIIVGDGEWFSFAEEKTNPIA